MLYGTYHCTCLLYTSNMKVCEEMGLDRDTYSVTIPLGATINMDGAAITITVMTMATAFTLGIHVDIPTAIILSLLAALSDVYKRQV